MAKDLKPNHWLASWSEDGTAIAVPIATFPQLTAAYQGEAEADRPNRMQINKSQSLKAAGQIVITYTFNFVLQPTAIDVADKA